jgi:hypothetical protein
MKGGATPEKRIKQTLSSLKFFGICVDSIRIDEAGLPGWLAAKHWGIDTAVIAYLRQAS